MLFRIGQGYDIHRFTMDRPLVLGGYQLPNQSQGLLGHSDADALTHAVIDAFIGALALGDIGQWFPDTDDTWKGAAGKRLVDALLDNPKVQGWTIVNMDTTIITQTPKLAPHIPNIRGELAKLFKTDLERVSVKAKTNEKLDDTGAGLALQAHAVILLQHP